MDLFSRCKRLTNTSWSFVTSKNSHSAPTNCTASIPEIFHGVWKSLKFAPMRLQVWKICVPSHHLCFTSVSATTDWRLSAATSLGITGSFFPYHQETSLAFHPHWNHRVTASTRPPFRPQLLSLDLCHNDLTKLTETATTIRTLPKLRNLILHGNPLAVSWFSQVIQSRRYELVVFACGNDKRVNTFCQLVPAYRGYIINTLPDLLYLDDVIISADEKHYYRGLCDKTGERKFVAWNRLHCESKVVLGGFAFSPENTGVRFSHMHVHFPHLNEWRHPRLLARRHACSIPARSNANISFFRTVTLCKFHARTVYCYFRTSVRRSQANFSRRKSQWCSDAWGNCSAYFTEIWEFATNFCATQFNNFQ